MISRPRRRFYGLPLALGVAAGTALLLEGLASWILFGRDFARAPSVAERAHTRYDPELGWVSRPGISLPDLYGKGIGLSTNAFGERGSHALSPRGTPGRRRVACSGDSFTLGYGVGDEDAWCAQLARLDPRLESVNLGMGGYGLDQSFLWWRREAARVAADVHVFTVNQYLVNRLARTDLLGYGKPTLALRDGGLVVENVPVPAAALRRPWLAPLRSAARRLRLAQLASGRADETPPAAASPHEWAPLIDHLLGELAALDRSLGTRSLIVFLPRAGDATHDGALPWRTVCRDAAARLSIPYLDLVPALRALPRDAVQDLFLLDGRPGAAGHYSVAGNVWVARAVLPALPLGEVP